MSTSSCSTFTLDGRTVNARTWWQDGPSQDTPGPDRYVRGRTKAALYTSRLPDGQWIHSFELYTGESAQGALPFPHHREQTFRATETEALQDAVDRLKAALDRHCIVQGDYRTPASLLAWLDQYRQPTLFDQMEAV